MYNKQRADGITFIMMQREDYDPDDIERTVIDLLSDVRHFCDQQELDYGAIDKSAYLHYLEERDDRAARPQTFDEAVAEAATGVIEELGNDLYATEVEMFATAQGHILAARDEIKAAITETWSVWIDEMKKLTIKEAKNLLDEDHECVIIFVFDEEGDGRFAYSGGSQFWQGESHSQYPYRAVASIPSPGWEIVVREIVRR